eukprot:CAMPEP_0182830080 /NCGR_PEP_ID=MMETSP0006_2-20121128/18382_1 /TAXON_ID=97485 /ORGANISM="Prymnesium parvum, Strain Texoma1" /LENGTH=87 /DNA_ID=CAMNT_0024957619 /DNA_START=601 /DNA_END=863 /DNA_ORIENTATION=-
MEDAPLGFPVGGPHRPKQLSQALVRLEQQQQGGGKVSYGIRATRFPIQQGSNLIQQHIQPWSMISSFGFPMSQKQQHGNGAKLHPSA